jgi:dolichol-phosphate mannosyltransferase
MNAVGLSLVIPCHNGEKNLQPLLSAIHATLDPLVLDYEIVITDDCSTDNSWKLLKQLAASDPRLRIQRFKFNCGGSFPSDINQDGRDSA